MDQAGLKTYVGVVPDGLNSVIVEVSGITGECTADAVLVLQTLKDRVNKRELATLPQLELAGFLAGSVDGVEPDMVVGGMLVCHMVLEFDDVPVGDGLSVG